MSKKGITGDKALIAFSLPIMPGGLDEEKIPVLAFKRYGGLRSLMAESSLSRLTLIKDLHDIVTPLDRKSS